MTIVEFLYDENCPNVSAARANLLRAFAVAGIAPKWTEYRIGDPCAPERTRGYGSPTVLVDGCDVGGVEPTSEVCCRIYATEAGMEGAPGVELISTALLVAARRRDPDLHDDGRGRSSLATIPGIGFAILPNLACPACWPAYAGAMTSMGLGFLLETRWLLPLTVLSLLLAIGALAYRARRRRGVAPFFVGLAGAVAILAGKFELESGLATDLGLGLLVGASIWNAWPIQATPACPACDAR